MRLINLLSLAAPGIAAQSAMRETSSSSASSSTLFSSNFHQPKPPIIKPEFKANWNQHKWNANLSHIASGYMYSSPSQGKVRVDLSYDSFFGSSLFDFTKVNERGIFNTQWLLSPSITSAPELLADYVGQPAFPLVQADLLVTSNAVYAGVVEDPDFGELTRWNILYGGGLPTTVLVGSDNLIHGYDFWDPNERTYATTRLFNIVPGKIAKDVFEFPTPQSQS